jgi:hypothetical protein
MDTFGGMYQVSARLALLLSSSSSPRVVADADAAAAAAAAARLSFPDRGPMGEKVVAAVAGRR